MRASFYTVTLQRSYKENGEVKNTNGYGRGDLMNAAKLLERAEEWIETHGIEDAR